MPLNFLLTFVTFFSLSSWSYAQTDSVATVDYVRGEVWRVSNQRVSAKEAIVRLRKGQKLHEGSRIRTSQNSFCRILMNDQTRMTLGPNSLFRVQQFKPNNPAAPPIYQLIQGQLRAHFSKQPPGKEAKLESRTVSLGVRGTEILLNDMKEANGESITQVALLSGDVEVHDKVAARTITLYPGKQFVSVIDAQKSSHDTGIYDMDKEVHQQMLAQSQVQTPSGELALAATMDMDGQLLPNEKYFLAKPEQKSIKLFKQMSPEELQRLKKLEAAWR